MKYFTGSTTSVGFNRGKPSIDRHVAPLDRIVLTLRANQSWFWLLTAKSWQEQVSFFDEMIMKYFTGSTTSVGFYEGKASIDRHVAPLDRIVLTLRANQSWCWLLTAAWTFHSLLIWSDFEALLTQDNNKNDMCIYKLNCQANISERSICLSM